MPIGPTNKQIQIKWFQQDGKERPTMVQYDQQDFRVWWTQNPKRSKQSEIVKKHSTHVEVVYADVKVSLTDKPKISLKQDTVLIEMEGINYSLQNTNINEFGDIYGATLYLTENSGKTP